MKTIIVDDEPLALEILESYIHQIKDLLLIAKCSNAIEANTIIREQKIDLIFLDIEMPVLRGTDFIKSLQDPPQVIFTTAYPEFAVEGFELNALDYLLKPISFDRFLKAINKFKETELKETQSKDFIFVKSDKKLVKLNFNEIVYIEGMKDYVIIHTSQSRIITLQTMKSLEEKLNKDNFVRIHRSYILNFDHINAIHGNEIDVIFKSQTKSIPIGNNYKEELDAMIERKKL
ncbi:MAG: response regulator transcription factor [Saprospiraceae bacterium]|nr:response regulator transcription factor [Saprospiraceae bacterium]